VSGGVIQRRAGLADRLHLAPRREVVERALHGALAGSKRQRQRRARPGLAVGEQRQQRGVLLVARPRQHGDVERVERRQREAAGGGVDAGDLGKRLAQAADLDAQPRAMRFVGMPGAEGASQQHLARGVARPGLGQRAGESEEDRPAVERDNRFGLAHDGAAGVDDKGLRREQCLDFVK
jgi:hypothetical protein